MEYDESISRTYGLSVRMSRENLPSTILPSHQTGDGRPRVSVQSPRLALLTSVLFHIIYLIFSSSIQNECQAKNKKLTERLFVFVEKSKMEFFFVRSS
jgi:hypothetical protein